MRLQSDFSLFSCEGFAHRSTYASRKLVTSFGAASVGFRDVLRRRGSRPALISPMKTRSQSRASSSDWIGRCLPTSIRGIANSLTGTRYRVPRWVTSKYKCSRHRRGFAHVRLLHLRQIAM
jgi:hypothetical protein